MDSGSRRVITSAGRRMRESELLIARAHATVETTYRLLHVPTADDPYVEWAREYGARPGLAAVLTRAMVDEAAVRIAVSDQLVALAKRLIRSSRERRRLDRKRVAKPPPPPEPTQP